MRFLLTIFISITFLFTEAQSPAIPYPLHDSGALRRTLARKWQLKPYASLSTGYIFLNGVNGGMSFFYAPIGLQLIRPLNKNISAFAGVSAAPAFFSINRLYTDPVINSSYPFNSFSNHWGPGLNARVVGGLMYTNDAGSFSISGSVGIEKSSYPIIPYERTNAKKR
jgi:hypothetical protein